MCLAQGHILVRPVRLTPGALPSRVKHSTTELPKVVNKLFQNIRISSVKTLGAPILKVNMVVSYNRQLMFQP